MTTSGHNRIITALSILALLLGALAAWGWGRVYLREVNAFLADGRAGMLQEERDAAMTNTNVMEVADRLRWIGGLYRPPQPPSGAERHHYNLVERVRDCYERDIMLHLRQLTGDNLPNEPKAW